MTDTAELALTFVATLITRVTDFPAQGPRQLLRDDLGCGDPRAAQQIRRLVPFALVCFSAVAWG